MWWRAKKGWSSVLEYDRWSVTEGRPPDMELDTGSQHGGVMRRLGNDVEENRKWGREERKWGRGARCT